MKKTIYSISLIIGAVFTIAIPSAIYAQPGALDASFGIGGIVNTDIDTADDKGYSIIQQTDGKLVLAGLSNNGSNNDFAVVRYNPDGSLDAGFGTAGSVVTPIGLGNEAGQAVILQPNGKILVAGFTSTGSSNDIALIRYNIDGTLDIGFGVGGIVATPVGSVNDQGQSVVLQTDGKIVVAGFTNNGTDDDFAVLRYDTSGVLDLTFDIDGIVTTDFGNGADVGRAVAVQTDGRIVVAGWSSNGTNLDFAVARYNTNGSLDNTFDLDGKVTSPIGGANDQGYSIAIQTDGRILVSGLSDNGTNQDFAVARYNTNGSLDNTFDTDGLVTTDFSGGNDLGYSIAVQTDTKILVAGQCQNAGDQDFGLVRYLSNGSLDNTFDTDGIVITDIGGNNDVGWAVTIQADDRVVVAGSNNLSSTFDFSVARYKVCEIIDTSVQYSGLVLNANALGANYQWVYCDSSYAPIPGATNQSYFIMNNGSYAVVVSVGNCADTSGCYVMNSIGIQENDFTNSITVYPNPTSGQLILAVTSPFKNASIGLMNMTGQTIIKNENLSGNLVAFDISEQADGIYFLEIRDGANIARIKIVKR